MDTNAARLSIRTLDDTSLDLANLNRLYRFRTLPMCIFNLPPSDNVTGKAVAATHIILVTFIAR